MCVQAQAGILAQRFLSMPEHERPTAIFSSVLRSWYHTHLAYNGKDRCLQTAAPIAQALGLPVYVEQGMLIAPRPYSPLNLVFY
jgi:transcription factor C subunit 7